MEQGIHNDWQREPSQMAYDKIKRTISRSASQLRDAFLRAPSKMFFRTNTYDVSETQDVSPAWTSPITTPPTHRRRRSSSEPLGHDQVVVKQRSRALNPRKVRFPAGVDGADAEPLSRRVSTSALKRRTPITPLSSWILSRYC